MCPCRWARPEHHPSPHGHTAEFRLCQLEACRRKAVANPLPSLQPPPTGALEEVAVTHAPKSLHDVPGFTGSGTGRQTSEYASRPSMTGADLARIKGAADPASGSRGSLLNGDEVHQHPTGPPLPFSSSCPFCHSPPARMSCCCHHRFRSSGHVRLTRPPNLRRY
jgi:hypothetical protein